MRVVVSVLMLVAFFSVLVGCDRLSDLLPGLNHQEIVLSDKPAMLGVKAVRFSADEPLKIMGKTTDICVTLASDVPNSDDTDADYEKLMGGANLSAVLHARDGKKYTWSCNGWSLSLNEPGRGTMAAGSKSCARMTASTTSGQLRTCTPSASPASYSRPDPSSEKAMWRVSFAEPRALSGWLRSSGAGKGFILE